jgi:ankyrin repeat protein
MKSESEKGRLATLAYRLAAATGQRAARWELKGPDVYSWEAHEGTVTVASRDHDGEPPYELALYNARSEKVDELASELLGDDQPAPWNEALAELYRVARRSALGADDIIDALLERLPGAAEEPAESQPSFLQRARANVSSSQ